MVTLNRVEKSGDIYNVTSQEFITNNEERKDTAIKTEVYTTALMENRCGLHLQREQERRA